ncbi:Gfo/Idh/MocA family protein [Nitratireductor sp. ZSWI3]|uniref:Gfo/Idh/MocA family protein n=1 Tax=Nitratireductor sp. ZSWI3 TaxID=2966359 RepID=UPI00214FACA3|nr:Gfo/Idh/MocA family oxidoreductase [Nitratireductor sp. ZSWI3]MCR4265834.1 Gfo/Idh/MocA family oxidoreductase [Nitratireductor sp. ZSWI3]
MKKIVVAVLGANGWMGKVHSNAYAGLERQFGDLGAEVRIKWLIDQDEAAIEKLARRLGGCQTSTDWTDAVSDPEVDLIDICLPDKIHYEVAKAALQAGKHVYCEKPMTDTGDQAREIAAIAREKGLITRVGHSFPVNPAHRLAKRLIDNGDIGDITFFKGAQHVDTHGSPLAPFIWRLDGDLAATGIVGDTGSHVFSFMDYLVGPIDELTAHCPILFPERPEVSGAVYGQAVEIAADTPKRAVTNPDLGMLMCRFRNGAVGIVDFSRIATGKRFVQRYEIYGTKGAITYDYDNITRLHVYQAPGNGRPAGFTAVDVGPDMPEYGAYLPLANFGLGYNEIKAYEVREVIGSIVDNREIWPTFTDAQRIVGLVDACMESHASRKWVQVNNGN